jgi:hypothetical protein
MRILAFLILSTLCAQAQLNVSNARFVAGVLAPPAGGGSCATPRDSMTGVAAGSANNVFTLYKASSFVAAANATICTVDLYLSKSGTPAGNISVAYYTDSGGSPGALIDESDAVAATGVASSEGAFRFSTGLSAAITSGNTFWVVLHCTSTGDGSDNVKWHFRGVGTGSLKESNDASSWSVIDSTAAKFESFSN